MVQIGGATGRGAAYINGFYEPTDEIVGRISVYRKVGDTNVWIEYNEPSGIWYVKSTSSRGKGDAGFASVHTYPPKPLEKCDLSSW